MNMLFPKPAKYKSKKLRDFARGQDCLLNLGCCNHDPETTVLCHIRLFGVAGMSVKPPDFLAFHACSECHRNEKDAGFDDILRALMLTLIRVYERFGTLTP